MADVKLFRVTEFAESLLQSPQSHRSAIHPIWVVLMVAVWIASIGHWPFWQAMVLRAEPGAVRPVLTLLLASQLALGALFWLALAGWRWLFKSAATALLVWTALGCCAMSVQMASGDAVAISPGKLLQFVSQAVNWGRILNWQCLLNILVIAVLPATLIWRSRIRRIPATSRVFMNVGLLVASYVLLQWSLGQTGHTLPSPLDPLNALRALHLE